MTPEQEKLALDTLSKCKGPFYYDIDGQMLFDSDGKMILEMRGWGWIQKLDDAENRQDCIGIFLTSLLSPQIFGFTEQPDIMPEAEIMRLTELYGRMNSLNKLKDPMMRQAAESAFADGLRTFQKQGSYNPIHCYGYSKSEWEAQQEQIKSLFGHTLEYTVEQYVNGLLSLIKLHRQLNVDLLKLAFTAGHNHAMKPLTTDLMGVDCPDFDTWLKETLKKPELQWLKQE